MYMADGAIDRCAEGGTSQCGSQVARAGAERGGGCLVVVAAVRNVAPSGIPIRRGGPVDGPTGAGCRGGDGGDVQAAPQPGGRGPGAGGRRPKEQRSATWCAVRCGRFSAKSAAMAERRSPDRSVQFEHAFDRLLAIKLEQVYGILVPQWVRAIGVDQSVRGKRDGAREV